MGCDPHSADAQAYSQAFAGHAWELATQRSALAGYLINALAILKTARDELATLDLESCKYEFPGSTDITTAVKALSSEITDLASDLATLDADLHAKAVKLADAD